jgi:signal transduction histidine kinase
VELSARVTANGNRQICVTDNGRGIAPEAIPFIFNRFYRADTTGKVKGTGLGLAIVKHAVEAHGGSITAESSPGKRTTFIISLPPDQK